MENISPFLSESECASICPGAVRAGRRRGFPVITNTCSSRFRDYRSPPLHSACRMKPGSVTDSGVGRVLRCSARNGAVGRTGSLGRCGH
jgi:hypothetical protein